MYILRVLETLLTDFSACLVYTRISTYSPGRRLPKIPFDQYFHISNFYIRRYSTKQVFLKLLQYTKENTCAGVSFNKVTVHYLATLLKEKSLIKVFSEEFWEIFKTSVLQKTSNWLRLFYGKVFYQQNSEEPFEKRKRMETAGKKNNKTLFSVSHDTLKACAFRNNAIRLRIYLPQKIISYLR